MVSNDSSLKLGKEKKLDENIHSTNELSWTGTFFSQ